MEYPKTTKLGRNDITLGVILAPLLQPCLVVVITWGVHTTLITRPSPVQFLIASSKTDVLGSHFPCSH